MIACLQREMIMSKDKLKSKSKSPVYEMVGGANYITPEELVAYQNREIIGVDNKYSTLSAAKLSRHAAEALGAFGPGRRMISEEEDMTPAELELLNGAIPSALSKLPDDFGYTAQPRHSALAKGPAFVAASQHFLKKNGVMPSNTDKLLEKADLLIEQMAIQNEALTSMVRLFTDYFLGSQDCGNIFYAVAPDQLTDGEDK